MAAAADRHPDLLERVSPELVLVDADLAEEMRRRLDVRPDLFPRVAPVEPRLSMHVVEPEDDAEREVEDVLAENEALLAPVTDEPARPDAGIDDLIVLRDDEDGPPAVPTTLVVAPDEGPQPGAEDIGAASDHEIDDLLVSRENGDGPPAVPTTSVETPVEGVPQLAPGAEDVGAAIPAVDDLIVVQEDGPGSQRPRGSYPALPSPSSDADEDATSVVLRRIARSIEPEAPGTRRRFRRLLSFVSLFAALGSIAIFAVGLQVGVSELPHWLPS